VEVSTQAEEVGAEEEAGWPGPGPGGGSCSEVKELLRVPLFIHGEKFQELLGEIFEDFRTHRYLYLIRYGLLAVPCFAVTTILWEGPMGPKSMAEFC
jgi:hypothetical protein